VTRTIPIWTLEARDSVLLDVMADYFRLSDAQMRNEISSAHAEVIRLLRGKGIDYTALRTALVPQADRLERGFLFDTARIEAAWYGHEVAEKLVPLLNPKAKCGIYRGKRRPDSMERPAEMASPHNSVT
jgi:hypothetical protein